MEVLTIGHSNHTVEKFVSLLQSQGVTAVADVRSSPYSQMYAQFNREPLAALLKPYNITYSFLGRELGGRPADKSCYENGRVQYERVAASSPFKAGLERLLAGTQTYRIAVMCAEREPLDCHRALLIAPELEKAGVNVVHVHADGQTESHSQAMARLLEMHGLAEADLFRSQSELIQEACFRQQERAAYTDKSLARFAGQER